MKVLMNKFNKKITIIVLTIIFGFIMLQFAPVVKAQAESGPTIYDSTYIDKLVIDIKNLIQSSNQELKNQIAATPAQTELEQKLSDTQKELATLKESMVFKIIKLPAGKTLVGNESTEIIVRSRNSVVAYVANTASGGVSNLISGKDIVNGVIIPDNQLILIPKADGRGITAKKDAYLMVKGTYTLK